MTLEVNPEFEAFFLFAMDHGFFSIEDGDGPLVPFTLELDKAGQRQLNRFCMERIEHGVEKAKNSIHPGRDIFVYAIVWDGFLTEEGQKWDAIMVEAGEASSSSGLLLAQRYIPGKRGLLRKVKAQRVGNPGLVERPPCRLLPLSQSGN